MRTKVIMLAHGSSNASWSDAFFDMTENVRTNFDEADLAFMELSEPSLFDVVRQAHTDGYQAVKVLPLFFATGRHLKKDVPKMIAALEEEFKITISLLPAIGENPILRKAIQDLVQDELK